MSAEEAHSKITTVQAADWRSKASQCAQASKTEGRDEKEVEATEATQESFGMGADRSSKW